MPKYLLTGETLPSQPNRSGGKIWSPIENIIFEAPEDSAAREHVKSFVATGVTFNDAKLFKVEEVSIE